MSSPPPTFWASLVISAQHHLPAPAPNGKAPQIIPTAASVHPHQLYPATQFPEVKRAAQVAQHALGPHLIRHARGAHPHGQEQPLRVGEDEALRSLYLLSRIVAMVATTPGRG